MADEYRVNLEVYNGPLDLLLYLIQRDELDIYDIPISRITEQYIGYVEMIHSLDPNVAGEFLVLASTLLEIKTRMLLPTPPPEEGSTTVDIDPRTELVRQLLQYKAFKDAAGDLETAATLQTQRFSRQPPRQESDQDKSLDLEDVQVWDLFDAFSKLMEAIGHRPTHHEVIYDDTPVELHAADIVDRLTREGPLTFSKVFEGRTVRTEIIGLFLAILELTRQKRIRAMQGGNFGEIYIRLHNESEPPEPLPQPVEETPETPAPEPTPEKNAWEDSSQIKVPAIREQDDFEREIEDALAEVDRKLSEFQQVMPTGGNKPAEKTEKQENVTGANVEEPEPGPDNPA